jgi:hypothetical protein
MTTKDINCKTKDENDHSDYLQAVKGNVFFRMFSKWIFRFQTIPTLTRLFQFILEVSGYTLPTVYIDIIMYDRENPDQTLSAMRI